MDKLRLWGRRTSANVQKAVWALEEVAVGYEIEERGGRFGGLDDPAYLAMNPNGFVPTLRDGDLTLWESGAIVRYLCARYGDDLYPTDPKARAISDQWAEWSQTRYQPAWISVFWKTYRTRPERRDHAAISAALSEAGKCFAILDRRLRASPFLAGEFLTYADIFVGTGLFRWFGMDIDRPETPAVAEWYERLKSRKGYQIGVMVPYDELRWTF